MPGFCYALSLAAEEGRIRPVLSDAGRSKSADKPSTEPSPRSALYCAPYIVHLQDVPRQENVRGRVTVCAQLIHATDSESKVT